MYQRSEEEEQATKQLLAQFFETELSTTVLSSDENQIVQEVLEYVANRFPKMKYILGLALDFTLLAQRLAGVDSDAKQFRQDLTYSELFQRYQPVTTMPEAY